MVHNSSSNNSSFTFATAQKGAKLMGSERNQERSQPPLINRAKANGFLLGDASLHSYMTPHGPDAKSYEAIIALGNEAGPQKLIDTMAIHA